MGQTSARSHKQWPQPGIRKFSRWSCDWPRRSEPSPRHRQVCLFQPGSSVITIIYLLTLTPSIYFTVCYHLHSNKNATCSLFSWIGLIVSFFGNKSKKMTHFITKSAEMPLKPCNELNAVQWWWIMSVRAGHSGSSSLNTFTQLISRFSWIKQVISRSKVTYSHKDLHRKTVADNTCFKWFSMVARVTPTVQSSRLLLRWILLVLAPLWASLSDMCRKLISSCHFLVTHTVAANLLHSRVQQIQ